MSAPGKSPYWERRHGRDIGAGWSAADTDRKWLQGFLADLAGANARQVLDLGCGLGYDATALAQRGYEVVGLDYSTRAIEHARARAARSGLEISYRVSDLAQPLALPDKAFDAVISNMVLHMFPQPVLESIVGEVLRVLRPGGLFLFHVNSDRDREPRLRQQAPARELEPGFFRLAGGQTMRFLDRRSVRRLLAGWTVIRIEHTQVRQPDGSVGKRALHIAARAPGAGER